MSTWWALLGNLVIAVVYAAISAAIVVPTARASQLRTNRLATATALIFFSCSVGHGLHAFGYFRTLTDTSPMAGMAMAAPGWQPLSAAWDVFTASVGLYYWTLRRGYGVLLLDGGLFVDPGQQRRLDESEARALVASRQAENQRALLAAVVENSEDAITGTTLDGVVAVWNSGAERMFGYPAEEVLGAPASGSVVLSDGVDQEPLLARIVGGERGLRYEAQVTRKDGVVVDVAVALSPILDSTGTVVGIARISRDLAATKLAAVSQRAAEDRANQAERMASLGQLAGGVAHDFNNLLGIILNFTAFAAENADDPVSVRSDLAKARTAAERAAGLTRQLLTFTRQDTVRPQRLDVNVSIAEAKDLLSRTIGAHINLIATPAPTPLMIYADEGHVQQVLVNLAINARDAMPDGGTLVIEAKNATLEEKQADVHPAPAGGRYVQLLVSDTGAGMTPEVVARIFEPFFTTKPKGRGTGLGLATVYGIIAGAGASIRVYSEPGIGTTFRVYFPVAVGSDPAAPAEPAVAELPRGHGEIVLIAEDEPALGEAVARILNDNGYRALVADGGTQALELDTEYGCDLLLTDVVMPDMSGWHLARLILDRHPGLPVLYMSGYTNGLLDAAHTPEFGISVLEKPFNGRVLLTEVDTILNTTSRPRSNGV